MKLTENFWMAEFHCRDGTKVPYEYVPHVTRLADILQIIRDATNSPLQITSGYRTPEHNARVGRASHSQHLTGKAADIVSQRYTPEELYETIERLIRQKKIPEGGLGLYNSFVHYDNRGRKARW